MDQNFNFVVNGKPQRVGSDPQRALLDVLREDLRLTGTKYGCGEGQCRVCTVLLDGNPIFSCLTPVAKAEGKSITTIEGITGPASGTALDEGPLHPLQQAFLIEGFQCGYCASGMIVMASALLAKKPQATEAEIFEHMGGNLCGCCNFENALRGIKRAGGMMVAGRNGQAMK